MTGLSALHDSSAHRALAVIILTPAFGFLVDRMQSYRVAWLALSALIAVAIAALPRVKEPDAR